LKRRDFLICSGLSGLGLALAGHQLLAQHTSILSSDSKDETKRAQPLLRFVAVGDVGLGNKEQYEVARAMNSYWQQNAFPLTLLLGDNIYPNGEIEKIKAVFEAPYQTLRKQGVRFYATLGNHDIRTNNGEDEIRYSEYNMPSRYYTFTQASVQFFAIDTNSNAPWEKQLKWLEENLANSSSAWKIVFGHHPLYSSGMHGGDRQLRERLEPLFSHYKVSLYLCGHDHDYERTKPINGTTYIVSGGGANTRPVAHSEQTAFSAAKLNFTTFEIYPNLIKINGIGSDGEIFDRAAILA
jgi:3',5'-cyclic AMP phosphodiesterase CpdA